MTSPVNFSNYQKYPPEQALQLYMKNTGKNEADAIADLEANLGKPTDKANGESLFSQDENKSTANSLGSNLTLDDLNDLDTSSETGFMSFIRNLFGLGEDSQEQPDLDPDTVAQKFADKNGITLEEAKEQLSAKFGEPQQK